MPSILYSVEERNHHFNLLPKKPWFLRNCMTLWLSVQEPVEVNFLSGIFLPLTSAEACEKDSRWLWKESCVSTGVRKTGNTCASQTALAVKVAYNQPTN